MNNEILRPLTQREYDVASVAADLLLKGNPGTRIAKYCLELGMTEEQIYRLTDKMLRLFGVDIGRDVHNAIYSWKNNLDADNSICFGKRLRKSLEEVKNEKRKH